MPIVISQVYGISSDKMSLVFYMGKRIYDFF